MPTNTLIPFKEPGSRFTGTATAAVTGKTAVDISGNIQSDNTYSVATCAAGAKPIALAEYDAAVGQWVGLVREGVVPWTAGAAINAGQQVQVGANGQCIPWDGTVASQRAGKCMTGVVAGADAMIALDIA